MGAADFPGRVRAASIDLARDFPLEDTAAPLPSVFELHPQPLIRVLDVDERARAVLQGAPLEEIETPAEPPWPAPPDAVAYHGVIGEVALAIAAETELDPAAILASLLTNFGVLVGNGWTLQSGSAQTASLYTALVGDTNDSRKGSTMHASGQVWKRATSGLSEDVLLPGVASGEGLASVLNDRSASGGRGSPVRTRVRPAADRHGPPGRDPRAHGPRRVRRGHHRPGAGQGVVPGHELSPRHPRSDHPDRARRTADGGQPGQRLRQSIQRPSAPGRPGYSRVRRRPGISASRMSTD